MACDDCTAARAWPDHRRFDLRCPYCGARYLQTLKTWPPPREIDGRTETTKQRQEWRAQVLRDWIAFGHDEQLLRELAAGEAVPLEPVEERHAEHEQGADPKPPGRQVRKPKDRRGRRDVRQQA
jgi:DNA-directed RNA polymerase subunit RPC12/RpoP